MAKKIHRFRIKSLPPGTPWELTDEHLVHQLIHVLKFKPGEVCALFVDGGDDRHVRIDSIKKNSILCTPLETVAVLQPQRNLIAAIALVKKDAFETIVEKLTELGVTEIIPIITERTIKQSLRLDRLQMISDEALEQSGGSRRVQIHEPMTLAQCLDTYQMPAVVFAMDAPKLDAPRSATCVMYIGPEGGWSDGDMKLFDAHAIPRATLGIRTLRAETAAIVGAYELLK